MFSKVISTAKEVWESEKFGKVKTKTILEDGFKVVINWEGAGEDKWMGFNVFKVVDGKEVEVSWADETFSFEQFRNVFEKKIKSAKSDTLYKKYFTESTSFESYIKELLY
jgi:hypothetical protein